MLIWGKISSYLLPRMVSSWDLQGFLQREDRGWGQSLMSRETQAFTSPLL